MVQAIAPYLRRRGVVDGLGGRPVNVGSRSRRRGGRTDGGRGRARRGGVRSRTSPITDSVVDATSGAGMTNAAAATRQTASCRVRLRRILPVRLSTKSDMTPPTVSPTTHRSSLVDRRRPCEACSPGAGAAPGWRAWPAPSSGIRRSNASNRHQRASHQRRGEPCNQPVESATSEAGQDEEPEGCEHHEKRHLGVAQNQQPEARASGCLTAARAATRKLARPGPGSGARACVPGG